jgi:hypothetical protein
MHQAKLWADATLHLQVVLRLYRLRFAEALDSSLSLQQIRGMEGVRVREAYARASRETGVPWLGRNYKRDEWGAADLVNRAPTDVLPGHQSPDFPHRAAPAGGREGRRPIHPATRRP